MTVQRHFVTSRYCEIAVSGQLIHLAGQLADDTSQDIRVQTEQTLANIDRLLAQVGSHKQHILSVLIFLKDIERDYAAMNAVWDAWLEAGHPPARTCVQSKLYAPDVLVEMTVTAVIPNPSHSGCPNPNTSS